MSQALLERWLAATRELIDAPYPPSQEALDALAQERERIAAALRDDPPAAAPPRSLAAELVQVERALEQLLLQLDETARARLGELRLVRTAATGYRPAAANRPAFVSKSI